MIQLTQKVPGTIYPNGTVYTTQQLEQMGENPCIVDGNRGVSASATSDVIGPIADFLTPTDRGLIAAVTGWTVGSGPGGNVLTGQGITSDFASAQNFADAIASYRQSTGELQPVTPSTMIGFAQKATADKTPFPPDFITNALGYLSGLG